MRTPANVRKLLLVAPLAGRTASSGPIFSPEKKFLNFIRLSFGNPWSERIEHALAKLGQIMATMQGETNRSPSVKRSAASTRLAGKASLHPV